MKHYDDDADSFNQSEYVISEQCAKFGKLYAIGQMFLVVDGQKLSK